MSKSSSMVIPLSSAKLSQVAPAATLTYRSDDEHGPGTVTPNSLFFIVAAG